MSATLLVTGATGFLGKVVLEELLRRYDDGSLAKVILVARGKNKLTAKERFASQVAQSACFERLPHDWTRRVEVFEGNLTDPRCGLSDDAYGRLTSCVTHIIHCAASVDFDRPVREAAASNIQAALHVLALAGECKQLVRLVCTSTAYVTPHRTGSLPETLVSLPRPAQELLQNIYDGVDEKLLLAETGHANTYTYTKCLAEHLLVQRKGAVPLSIVRPSIISASLKWPRVGWIDSRAAFAGFVVTIGSGVLRMIDGDPNARLDLVPVDVVAAALIDAAMAYNTSDEVPIVHAVAGLARCAHVGATSSAIVRFFQDHPVVRRPSPVHVGHKNVLFSLRESLHHDVALRAAAAVLALRKDMRASRRARRTAKVLRHINEVFPYFTHHTFDFAQAQIPAQMAEFDPRAYVQVVCRGAYTHLMRQDGSQIALAGSHMPKGNLPAERRFSVNPLSWPKKAVSEVVSRFLARLYTQISYDERSFEQAMAGLPDDVRVVFAPTYRSALDPLLMGLVAQRIGIFRAAKARIQTAHDVRLGRRLENMVYLQQGQSRAHGLDVIDRQALHALMCGPQKIALIAVSLTYECVPEGLSMPHACDGSNIRLQMPATVAQWFQRALTGKVHLGQAHLCAADAQILTSHDNIDEQTDLLRANWRRQTVATKHALNAFVGLNPDVTLDVAALCQAVAMRGCRVLKTVGPINRRPKTVLSGRVERSLRHQWQHVFFAELAARWPDCLAITLAAHGSFKPLKPIRKPDQACQATHNQHSTHVLGRLHQRLAKDISHDVVATLRAMAQMVEQKASKTRSEWLKEINERTHLGDVAWAEQTLDAMMLQQGRVLAKDGQAFVLPIAATELRTLAAQCGLGTQALGPREASRDVAGTALTKAIRRPRVSSQLRCADATIPVG